MNKIDKNPAVLFFFVLLFLLFSTTYSYGNVVIQAKIEDGKWKTVNAIYPLKGQKVFLKVDAPEAGLIRWYQIVPDISRLYKNANFPWDNDPYKLVGFAKIKYHRYELMQFRGQQEIIPSFKNKYDSLYKTDAGSFWVQAEVTLHGKKKSSPGIESSDHRGLSPNVFRISVRDGEGYIGYLTSFFNVPGLFGSVTYQSTNYIGVDCADAVMAAYSRWRQIPLKKNYNVSSVVNDFSVLHKIEFSNGRPSKKVYWGRDVKQGDFIAVKYYRHRYIHIGALYKDDNRNGYLDGDDIVLHAGPSPLHYSSLVDGGFDGSVAIVRP